MTAPAAVGGQRPQWEHLPQHVRQAIATLLGAEVLSAVSQPGGFTPGFASRIELADGRRAFVKAGHASQNEQVPKAYAREARIVSQLPSEVACARLLAQAVAEDGWQLVAFEDVEGRNPALPWTHDDLGRVLEAMTVLADSLSPSPIEGQQISDTMADEFSLWSQALEITTLAQLEQVSPWCAAHLEQLCDLEPHWREAARGQSLQHFDLRADNIILAKDRVVFVDWTHAGLGAAWVDLLGMLPSVLMHGGHDAEQIVTSHPLTRSVEPGAITAVLSALTSYFVIGSFRPAPEGLPTVRAFQRAQGVAAAEWLARRMDN